MAKTYKQLSIEDRDQIAVLRQTGWSLRRIARRIVRDPGTLSRELKRNAAPVNTGYYSAHRAQVRADLRKDNSHQRGRLPNPALRAYVRRQVPRGWSPERIAGRWKLLGNRPISYEAIYQWIYAEARELVRFLPRAHRKRMRHCRVRGSRFIPIPSRTPVSQRPKAAENRRQAGHWEADLILGARQLSVLQVLIERKSRYARLTKLRGKGADEMRRGLNQSLAQYPKHMRRTITFDNGRENVQHQRVDRTLGTKSYFCEPMHSWEKGSVENAAGLVRRRLPRRTDFAMVSEQYIKKTERWLNGLPRKCLGYKTAAEVFRASVALAG